MLENSGSILIVEDDEDFSDWLAAQLEFRGYETAIAHSISDALNKNSNGRYDLVLLDVHLPDGSGVDVIRSLKSQRHPVSIIMMSTVSRTDLVVRAMQEGASDYFAKPPETDRLFEKIESLLKATRVRELHDRLKKSNDREPALVGTSSYVNNLLFQIGQISIADAPVLIQGETGTGKSLLAKVIHENSLRRNGPFVAVNCAAIPENLIESELFGHEKGAFTGADRERAGRFEIANGGTLFLDEIGEMPAILQPKLLRVLQGKEFERVGGNKTRRCDVRIIAATNANLQEAIQAKKFREDLFYRLNVLPLYAAALRERRDDVLPLAEHFLKAFARKYHKEFSGFTETSRIFLETHDWPGNVRELENLLERSVIYGKPPLLDLLRESRQVQQNVDAGENYNSPTVLSVSESGKRKLLDALHSAEGNVSLAARKLGIGRDTVYRRMKKFGIVLK